MPAPPFDRVAFDYAVIRVVPRVEREEFLNVGAVLFCPERKFLGVRAQIDEKRLHSLWPEIDIDDVRRHVAAFTRVAEGEPDAGPIARLSQRERFHWLVSPRSTILQVSPVHTGMCGDPGENIERLFRALVQRIG